MKKLMIAAAAAALAAGAQAADAQVYNYSAKLKTTNCKGVTVSKTLANYFANHSHVNGNVDIEKGDKIGVRKQASRTIDGVIWGCDCPTIQNPAWRVYNGKTLGGYIFWDKTVDDYFRVSRTEFKWVALNRIDTMTKCEGAYELKNDVDGQAIYLAGAGFGTVKDNDCATYISSISGNVAGFRQPNAGDYASCVFCNAGEGCIVEPLCDWCYDVAYDTSKTVAYGTWSIKYNSSAAKKLAENGYLSNTYTFKKAGSAKDTLAQLEKLVKNGATPDDDEVMDPMDPEYNLDGLKKYVYVDEDGEYLEVKETDGEATEAVVIMKQGEPKNFKAELTSPADGTEGLVQVDNYDDYDVEISDDVFGVVSTDDDFS